MKHLIFPESKNNNRQSTIGSRQSNRRSQIIQRTRDLTPHRPCQLQVDHRGADVRMTQQLLHAPDIHPTQHQMRRETVPQRVRRDLFLQPRRLHPFKSREAKPFTRPLSGSTESAAAGNNQCHVKTFGHVASLLLGYRRKWVFSCLSRNLLPLPLLRNTSR